MAFAKLNRVATFCFELALKYAILITKETAIIFLIHELLMKFSQISLHRSSLMGLAILMVVLYHTRLKIPFVSHIGYYGYWGVDIFLIASGFGIFYSLEKHKNLKEYFFKRLIRIVPAYWIVVSAFLIWKICVHNATWHDWFLNMFGLSYWLNIRDRFDWFIPTICFYYVLAPILVYFIKKGHGGFALALSTLICWICALFLPTLNACHLNQCIIRLPVFFAGLYFAWLSERNTDIPCQRTSYIVLLLLVLVEALLMHKISPHLLFKYGIYYYFSAAGAIPLTILVSNVLNHCKKIQTFLGCCGVVTLEIYLLHERIIAVIRHYYPKAFLGSALWGGIVAFVLSVIGAMILKTVLSAPKQKLEKRKQ